MNWSASVASAVLAGALVLPLGAVAQNASPNGAREPAAESADAGQLERVLDVRSGGNDDAAGAQKRIDALSDETDDLLRKYRSLLKQIDSIDIYNGQMRELLQAQDDEIASLVDQVGRIQSVGRSVTPLMFRMVDALEKFVDLDVPFLPQERGERIASLREMMGRADVTTAEKFRQIMEAYQIENEYGRTIEAYRASLVQDGKESTVDFLRFGRIALVYQTLDESQSGRWDQDSGAWVTLDSSHRTPIRNGLRIARKQAAPDLVLLPLPAPTNAQESK